MRLDLGVRRCSGRKHMALDALPWLFTSQTDVSDFNDELPAYAVSECSDKPDERDKNDQELQTTQRFVAT